MHDQRFMQLYDGSFSRTDSVSSPRAGDKPPTQVGVGKQPPVNVLRLCIFIGDYFMLPCRKTLVLISTA